MIVYSIIYRLQKRGSLNTLFKEAVSAARKVNAAETLSNIEVTANNKGLMPQRTIGDAPLAMTQKD
jgi:hypothetical protein